MKKKVLLMGASGSGKTSMRSLIFSNNPASLTTRLGATIDVEQNHVRFLGDLILNLWDCGGQDAFMDSYLSTQQSTIFQHVGVLIYVFEVESRCVQRDLEYYMECMHALKKFSPDAAVFLLVHKMDLVRPPRGPVLEKRAAELRAASGDAEITVFGTSIYDESLYKAWSRIVHTLIPNASVLTRHLGKLADACNATEVVLFERTTFLVIATSSHHPPSPPAPVPSSLPQTPPATGTTPSSLSSFGSQTEHGSLIHEEDDNDPHKLEPTRYERTSELIKAFKHSCTRVREEFHALEMELADFTAVLDELTKNTYVLIVAHDPTVETAALRLNIRLARKKFEELQSDSLLT
ncbi:GTR/RAG family GTP-binding protein [Phanerochaete sordida]|uniref:GTP-binding protein n=1 Tax=Phanerochaete sordida TaxID=48140 RepID=A0A9P3G2I5_9APHY|nr:GTR/RAG family GTP-binding protein [Phanerochaete sordida]